MLDVNVAAQAHRGMLGIAVVPLHPPQPTSSKHENVVNSHNSTTTSAYVFLYYTEAATKDGDDITEGKQPLGNRLYRYEMVNNKLVNPKLLLDLPATPGAIGNGGRIAIGPDNNVYVTIGDVGYGILKMVWCLVMRLILLSRDLTVDIIRLTVYGYVDIVPIKTRGM